MKKKIFLTFIFLVTCFSTLAIESKKQEKTIVGLDVRSKLEIAVNKARGALNIHLSDINEESVKELDKSAQIKVFCEAGARADKAKTKLEALGFKNVENIGSWRDWNEEYAPKPVRKTNKEKSTKSHQ